MNLLMLSLFKIPTLIICNMYVSLPVINNQQTIIFEFQTIMIHIDYEGKDEYDKLPNAKCKTILYQKFFVFIIYFKVELTGSSRRLAFFFTNSLNFFLQLNKFGITKFHFLFISIIFFNTSFTFTYITQKSSFRVKQE